MKHFITLLFLISLFALPDSAFAAPPSKPNIAVILVDDLGFSDLGCYGSEIATPALDQLATDGLRFTQFYNTAKCHSSRVSLLSGRWCRQAGDESLKRAVIIPEILQPAGYFTAMTGKWHLSKEPTDFGFERYFGHLSGATNYYRGDKTFRLNGQPWEVPATGFYTTVANVDHAIRFVDEGRSEQKPWFLYLAFNAPHAPLQPLREDYEKFRGKYDKGWDEIRKGRLARQRELGLFGRDVEPSPRPSNIPPWNELSAEIREWESRRMSAYAAMIYRIDQEVGRLVAHLRETGELDNTILMFFSDNGACPYDRNNGDLNGDPCDGVTAWSDSTGWAWARNSPFRYYKQNQFEGGIATPAIFHWPAGIKAAGGSVVHEPAHLVDVMPTLTEITGAEVPATYPERDLAPLAGVSLKPILDGATLGERPPIHFLFSTDRGLREGDWKLVSFQNEPWELYRINEDRTELHDLAMQHPDIVARLAEKWHKMASEVLRAPAKETAPVTSSSKGKVHREWSNYSGIHGAETSSRVVSGKTKVSKKKEGRVTPKSLHSTPHSETSLEFEESDSKLTVRRYEPGKASGSSAEMKPGSSIPAAENQRPNVLFLIVDDMTTTMSCQKWPAAKTPHIDALAGRGVRFNKAFCQFALCNPTRASFLTGCYPEQTGVIDLVTSFRDAMPDVVTLPQHFKNHGYQTASIGKVFHVKDPKTTFDIVHRSPLALDQKILNDAKKSDPLDKPRQGGKGDDYNLNYASADRPDSDFTDYQIAERSIASLDELEEGPFFMAVGFIRPHTPFVAPQWAFDAIDRSKIPLPPFYSAVGEDISNLPESALRPNNNVFRYAPPTRDQAIDAIHAYLAAVYFVDHQIGRLLAELDQRGLTKNTIIVLTGDHGYQLGEHGLWAKQTLFDEANHVPLIFAGPEIKPGVCQALVEQVDIYPTLATLAKLPLPAHLQGTNLVPWIDDPTTKSRIAVFSTMIATHTEALGHTARNSRYRYIEWNGANDGVQLYDLQTDPQQLTNLAGQADHYPMQRRLKSLLQTHLSDVANKQ